MPDAAAAAADRGFVSPDPVQYHPTAEKLKTSRKHRHRRTGSHGSGNFAYLQTSSPKNSPHRERRVRAQTTVFNNRSGNNEY